MRVASQSSAGNFLFIAFFVLAAIAFGYGASTGSLQIFVLLTGALFVPLILLMSSTWLVSVLLALVFVIVGSLDYFAKLHQIHWLPSLVFMGMLVRAFFELFSHSKGIKTSSVGIAPPLLTLYLFFVIFLMSAFVNAVPVMQAVVGLRHYVFPFALTAVIALAHIPEGFWVRVWKWLPLVLILQFPVCAYQNLFVARGREQKFGAIGISWDAVVGTFGGDADAGGASGALALFLCFGIASIVALRKAGVISRQLAVLSFLCAVGAMLLAEVKVVAVFLPLAFLILNRKDIFRSGFKAAVWLAGTAAFVVALLIAYNAIFWKGKTTTGFDLSETVDYVLKAETDPRFISPLTREVSRYGAILLWTDENISRGDPSSALLGYGPAASKFSSLFGYGSAARSHSFILTTSTISTALWDLGLLGTFAYLTVFGLVFFRVCSHANKLRAGQPAMAAVFDSLAIGLGLIVCGTFYNSDLLNNPAIQSMAAMAVGLALRPLGPEMFNTYSKALETRRAVAVS